VENGRDRILAREWGRWRELELWQMCFVVWAMVMFGMLDRGLGSRVVVMTGLEERSGKLALISEQEAISSSVEKRGTTENAHRPG
jgi:hypothetical protein